MRTAILDADLRVVNIIEGAPGFAPPPGYSATPSDAAAIGDVWNPANGAFTRPGPPVEQRRAARLARAQAERDAIMAAGAPYGGKRIEVDDASRANLNGVVTTALIAQAGGIAWPDALSQGWITMDNTRIPLPAPADAVMLGLTVLSWYAALIQLGRDIKDTILAAPDPDAVPVGWGPFAIETGRG